MTPIRFLLITGTLVLTGCMTTSHNDGSATSSSSEGQICTMEAKLCPDGSYVGRTGPNCAFAACPGDTTTGSSVPDTSSFQSVSDGTISFSYPPDFGLATTKEQILVSAYIPPCDEGFNYCLYYNGTQYAGTNFESAGIAITNRTDLASESDCLNKQPDGYDNLTPLVRDNGDYKTSMFSPLGDAAMGHYANDNLYRLAVGGSCYEFRTRVGSTQFANFPPGTIKEFTSADVQMLQAKLDAMVAGVTLKNGEKIVLPDFSGSDAE